VEELVSGELNDAQLAQEMTEVVTVLRHFGLAETRVEHWSGYGAVSVDDLPTLRSAEEDSSGKLLPWPPRRSNWDFDIYADELKLHFIFCHHDEVHLRCDNPDLKQHFWNRWEMLGYDGRWRNSIPD